MGPLGDGRAQAHSGPRGFFQELVPQDGSGYMDVGKVTFTFPPFQGELFSFPSLGGGRRESQENRLPKGYSTTYLFSGLSQKARGEGAQDSQGGGQLR